MELGQEITVTYNGCCFALAKIMKISRWGVEAEFIEGPLDGDTVYIPKNRITEAEADGR